MSAGLVQFMSEGFVCCFTSLGEFFSLVETSPAVGKEPQILCRVVAVRVF